MDVLHVCYNIVHFCFFFKHIKLDLYVNHQQPTPDKRYKENRGPILYVK